MKKYIISAGVTAALMSAAFVPAKASAAGCISADTIKSLINSQGCGTVITSTIDCGNLSELITKCMGQGTACSVNNIDAQTLLDILCTGNCADIINPQNNTPASEEPEKPSVTQAPVQTAAPEATQKPAPAATQKPVTVPTQAPTSAPAKTDMSSMEHEVLRLVNEERAKYGLGSLTWAEDLAVIARAHSRDMIARNFFDHTNPDGQSPFDRLKKNGISYRAAAENIAAGQSSPEAVMNSWMNSSGHRANILNGSLKELGVGAVKNSNGRIYWTQLFVTR